MSRTPYTKPPLTYPQLLHQLKSRELLFNDEDKALHLLRNISYYRLSGYWYPLLDDKALHTFKPGANFETAFKLYCFDRELRLLVIREIEKIEVAVRSQLNHILAHNSGMFWFTDTSLFNDLSIHSDSIRKFNSDFRRSDEQFVTSFKSNYNDPLPPCWMMLEITSFGSLSKLYDNLKPGRPKIDIAKYFGLSDRAFTSWLHTLVYLRNVCAHHNRLWNRILRITPLNPRSPHNQWLNTIPRTDKTYFALSMIKYLLNTVNPKSTFTQKFAQILKKYPNVDVRAMGFPNKWESEPLWKDIKK